MSHTRFVAHGIVSASVKSNTREGTTWTEFLFTDAAGAHHEVTVFHDDPLEIEGADFMNHDPCASTAARQFVMLDLFRSGQRSATSRPAKSLSASRLASAKTH